MPAGAKHDEAAAEAGPEMQKICFGFWGLWCKVKVIGLGVPI